MTPRLLLVNDTSTSANQGCQATMHALNSAMARLFPAHEIVRVPLTTVARPVTDKAWAALLPNAPDDYAAAVQRVLHSKLPDVAAVVEAFRTADLVVVNGEGSIAENRKTRELGEQSVFLFVLLELAAHFDVPCHLINCTLHLTRPESLAFAREPLGKCASVSVREPFSYHYGRQICSSIKLFPDLVCTLLPPVPPAVEGRYVMLGGSAAVNVFAAKEALPPDVRKDYDRICQFLIGKGLRVKLMGWNRDEFLREFEREGADYVECDFQTYFAYCAGAEFNVTGRHHGIVMTFAAGCPFTAISANSFKIEGDSMFYGGAGAVQHFERMSVDRMESTCAALIERHEDYKAAALEQRETLRPFFAGALENIVTPRDDVVATGAFQPSENPADYGYDGWHRRNLLRRVAVRLANAFGA